MSSVAAPQSVGRIFAVLELLAEHGHGSSPGPGMTLSALARACDAPKASLLALLSGMVADDYLVNDSRGYRTGPRLHSLSMRLASRFNFVDAARPVMARLVETTGETALLGVATPGADQATYIASVESDNPVRYTVRLGEQRELYCTAVGKLVLAWRSKKDIERYLTGRRLHAFTPRTIVDRAVLIKELATIRAERLAETTGERVVGAAGLAVPVLRPNEELAAVLTLSGPSERMRSRRREFIALLRKSGDELNALLAQSPAIQIPSAAP